MNKGVDGQRLSMNQARVAVVGYDADAKLVATGLRRAGNHVVVGVCVGGMSRVRAQRDGFVVKPSPSSVEDAEVVAIHLPAEEHCSIYWRVLHPHTTPNALLVFGGALALATVALVPRERDVVIVTGDSSACRVAVHADVTGRALERGIAFARAAYGEYAQIGTTTVAAEAEREIAEREQRAGGRMQLVEEIHRAIAHARDSHAPDETRLAFYEAIDELIAHREHAAESSVRLVADDETTSAFSGQGPRRGVA